MFQTSHFRPIFLIKILAIFLVSLFAFTMSAFAQFGNDDVEDQPQNDNRGMMEILADEIQNGAPLDLTSGDDKKIFGIYISTFLTGSNKLSSNNFDKRYQEMMQAYQKYPDLVTDRSTFTFGNLSFQKRKYEKNPEVNNIINDLQAKTHAILSFDKNQKPWNEIEDVDSFWTDGIRSLGDRYEAASHTIKNIENLKKTPGYLPAFIEELAKIALIRYNLNDSQKENYRDLLNNLAQIYFWIDERNVNTLKSGDGMAQWEKAVSAIVGQPNEFFHDVLPEYDNDFEHPVNIITEDEVKRIEEIGKHLKVLSQESLSIEIRPLNIFELPFSPKLGYHCSRDSEWEVYAEKSYIGYTITYPNQSSKGLIMVALGHVMDDGHEKPVAIIEEIDNIDVEFVNPVLKGLTTMLQKDGYSTAFNKTLVVRNGVTLSNDRTVQDHVERSPFFKNSKQIFLNFEPLKLDDRFPERHSILYSKPTIKIIPTIPLSETESLKIIKKDPVKKLSVSLPGLKKELAKLRQPTDDIKLRNDNLKKYFRTMQGIPTGLFPDEDQKAAEIAQGFTSLDMSEGAAQAILRYARNQNAELLGNLLDLAIEDYKTKTNPTGLNQWTLFYENQTTNNKKDSVMRAMFEDKLNFFGSDLDQKNNKLWAKRLLSKEDKNQLSDKAMETQSWELFNEL